LAQCGGKETNECDAKMTAVMECEGEKGDSSGLNQKPKPDDAITKPLLG